ncbi:MAG TPA: hypothetical protein VMX33_06590 [bacterium]|nr:hypothetical protein [bacterium]
MNNRRLAVAITGIMAFTYTMVFADEPLVAGFDRPAYESSLVRAERAATPGSWLAEARSGIGSAMARWEHDAACLYDDPEAMAEARSRLSLWSDRDIATRFASWLQDRFFGREAARVRGLVETAAATANGLLLYAVDEDGAVLLDGAGDPVYARSDGIAADTAAWRSETTRGLSSALSEYDARLESLRPELLASIEPGELSQYESIMAESLSVARGRAAIELNALADREERLFVARRTTDVWSLRRKAEGEAASDIAAELSKAATIACESGTAALNARIEAAGANVDGLELAGSAWLAAFKEQFDRGLSAWESAEERFIVRRLEWERDASQAYDEGNQTWVDAFARLEAERRSWEDKASTLFRDGEAAFSGASAALESSIHSAKMEYENQAAERIAMSSDRASAWADVYMQCGQSMSGEYANASYWLSELGPEAPGFGDAALPGWLAGELDKTDIDAVRRTALESAAASIDRYDYYRRQAAEAQSMLLTDLDVALGTGNLDDILSPDVGRDVFHLDEYQIELVRASAVAGYWRRRADIARAVLAYANDTSSDRATEAELLTSLGTASAACDEALSTYDSALSELSAAGDSIGVARCGSDSARTALGQAGARLEEVNSAYATLMSVLLTDDGGFLHADLVARYRELVALDDTRGDSKAPSEAELFASYLAAAGRLGQADAVEYSGEALRLVVSGSAVEPSLAELKHAAMSINVPCDGADLETDPSAYGLTAIEPAFAQLLALHNDLMDRLSSVSEADAAVQIQLQYAALAASIVAAARDRANSALEGRLDAVSLLGAPTLASWYEDRAGHASSGNVIATLTADVGVAWRGLIVARARLELAALDMVATGIGAASLDQTTARLASWWEGDELAEANARAILCSILACDDSALSDDSFAASLDSLGTRNIRVADFARGHGFFADGDIDRASLLCGSETLALNRAVGRQAACSRYAGSAMAAESARYASSLDSLDAGLNAIGLTRAGDGSLPGVDTIGVAMFAAGDGLIERIAALTLSIDTSMATAPAWMRDALSAWSRSVISYLASCALCHGQGEPVSSAEIWSRLADNRQASAELQDLLQTPCDDDEATVRRLSLLVDDRCKALLAEAASLHAKLEYALAYERLRDEAIASSASGALHWRQHLASATITQAVAAPSSACASWIEGSLSDCLELAGAAAGALESALSQWQATLNRDQYDSGCHYVVTQKYISNPEASFDLDDIWRADPELAAERDTAYAAYSCLLTTRSQTRNAFAATASVYELAMDKDALQDRVTLLAEDIAKARDSYDKAMADYASHGGVLAAAGAAYDAVYARVASLDRAQEVAKTEYEKLDAIRRWACTSYLAASEPSDMQTTDYRGPSAEALYAEESLARAEVALAALQRLYDPDESGMAYSDPAFAELYEQYRGSYSMMMLTAKARDILGASIQDELAVNACAYESYVRSIGALQLGRPSESWYPYLRLDDTGMLRFAHGDDFSMIDVATSASIDEYFSSSYNSNIEALAGWMSNAGFDESRARSWGLARDYVLASMASKSAEFAAVASTPSSAIDETLLGGHRFTLLGQPISDILADYRSGELGRERRAAYEEMGNDERRWFETYLALQVVGAMKKPVGTDGSGAETFDAFSYWSSRAEYQKLESVATSELHVCDVGTKASAASYAGFIAAAAVAGGFFVTAWLVPGFLAAAGVAYAAIIGFSLTASDINATRSVYATEMNDLQRQTSLNVALMTAGMEELVAARSAYQESCDRLAGLSAAVDLARPVDAAALADSLTRTGRLSGAEVSVLTDIYTEYRVATGAEHLRADEALVALSAWTQVARNESRRAVDDAYTCDASLQSGAQEAYRSAYVGYVSGQASLQDLTTSAIAAFGTGAPSAKQYDALMAAVCVDSGLTGDMSAGPAPIGERAEAAVSLAGLIARATADKYAAELAAREAEWDVRRSELSEKLASWREAAGLILARGRADFSRGADAMRECYDSWASGFSDTYANRQAAWNVTYYELQAEKLSWVATATDTANRASSDAMFAMVGSDAEASARRFDACTVLELTTDTSADNALERAIEMAGISSMADALASQSGIVRTMSPVAMGGLMAQKACTGGLVQVAARAFIDKASAELAGAQSRIMATRARLSAESALAALSGNVRRANDDFAEAMNERFVARGKWQRQEGSYVKDVVVHSTLFQNYITEKATVAVYDRFVQRDGPLETDMSDRAVAALDAFGIRALIDEAQREIARRHEEIFGTDLRTSGVAPTTGTFGSWVGSDPRLAEGADPDGDCETMFADQGSGELGRLMRNYIKWSLKEGKGWMEANKPSYEKSLWDDRGDWFKAPSIRGIADVGLTVAATVLSGGTAMPAVLGAAAINLADDAVFNTIDVAGGYRSMQDAGISFLRKTAMASVSMLGGGVFNGFGQSSAGFFGSGLSAALDGASGLAEVAGHTTLLGLRSVSTGLANAAICAVSWDGSGLSWSGTAFASGIEDSLVSAAVGMTGTMTRGILNQGLEGFTGAVYDNGLALSGLGGGLAAQGVQYALTGSAAFNVANFNMFGIAGADGAPISMGLLAMRLGRGGLNLGLGSDGSDISLGTVSQAAMGLESWAVNARLAISGQEESTKYASALRTLYSAGDASGAERNLYDRILAGDARICEDYTGDYGAQTTFDETTGISTISLGRGSLTDTSRFGMGILLAHESYRDGINNGYVGQNEETARAVFGHIGVAASLGASYGSGALSTTQRQEVGAMRAAYDGEGEALASAFGVYDASGDFWRLQQDGSIAYDGFATLRDEDGNIIRSAASMGVKESQIEGSLLEILGIDQSSVANIEAVRQLMVNAGMQHSFAYDSDQWLWARTQSVAIGASGSFPMTQAIDLTVANQGKSISIESIGAFYDSIGASKKMVQGFIGKTYGSAIGLLEYAGDGLKTQAEHLLSRVYTRNEVKMIQENKTWYDDSIRTGISVDTMITGDASRTTEFGVDTGNLSLATSSVPGAAYFQEWHTGIDYGSGGSSVQTPGGYWQFDRQRDHRAYFSLFGGDIKMRLMHLNPNDIMILNPGGIIGDASGTQKLFNYPTQSYGTGTAAHVHVDFTRRLPYAGAYQRQFVDPETLSAGNRLDYSFSYLDTSCNPLAGYPQYFDRY